MKYNGQEVFFIVKTLSQADSTAGGGRTFIRSNKKRFFDQYVDAIGWVGDYEDEYDELTVLRSQAGEVAAFSFDLEKSVDGHNAFMEHLNALEYEVDPYVRDESVLELVDGVTLAGEDILRGTLTTQGIADRVKKQKETE